MFSSERRHVAQTFSPTLSGHALMALGFLEHAADKAKHTHRPPRHYRSQSKCIGLNLEGSLFCFEMKRGLSCLPSGGGDDGGGEGLGVCEREREMRTVEEQQRESPG